MKYDLDYISKNETWVPIEGYEGKYEVSSFGQIRSLNYNKTCEKKIMKQCSNSYGYLQLCLCKNGKVKRYFVHRLVATAFLPNPENLPCINHIDEDKQNNHVDNLEWCSVYYNNTFGSRIKTVSEKQINDINKSKPVLQYTLSGYFVAEYPSTREVERQFGFLNSHISLCCLGKLKTAYGYLWKYK